MDGLLEEQLAKKESAQTQYLILLSPIVVIINMTAFLMEQVVLLVQHATLMELQEQIQIKQIYAIHTKTLLFKDALIYLELIVLTQLLVLHIP